MIFLFSVQQSFSQTEIGHRFDINGLPFDGYFDPLAALPFETISKNRILEGFLPGVVEYKDGTKKGGFLDFKHNKVFFKSIPQANKTKIKLEDINYFKIGTDSFIVIDDFDIGGMRNTKPNIVKYLNTYNGNTLVRHYHFTGGAAHQLTSQAEIIESYLVKEVNQSRWVEIEVNNTGAFKRNTFKYFGFIPIMKQLINRELSKSILKKELSQKGLFANKALNEKDFKDILNRIIKIADYYKTYSEGSIWFNQYWEETNNSTNVKYSSKVVDLVDSLWTIDYYKGNQKIYQVKYVSLFPHIKTGDFLMYFPNGKIRKKVSFIENEPKKVEHYSQTGTLLKKYSYKKVPTLTNTENRYDVIFEEINNPDGTKLYKGEKEAEIVFYDEISKKEFQTKIRNGKITYSAYQNSGKIVHQIPHHKYALKKTALRNSFSSFVELNKRSFTSNPYIKGTVLISLIIDSNGYAIQGDVLSQLSEKYNTLIKNYVKLYFLSDNSSRFKFKPYKTNSDQKAFYELTLPLEINYQTISPISWRHYDSFFFMNLHHHQFHHQHNIPQPPQWNPSGF